MTHETDLVERALGPDTSHADHPADDVRDAQNRAVDTLAAVFRRVQREVASSGWLMIGEPLVRGTDNDIVRFAMLRDGMIVSECGFSIGPGLDVAFGRPAHRAITGVLGAMGEAEFHQLIVAWVGEVQAGVGHRWPYEAKRRAEGA
jgi:hypothetical protein